jgi:hypothetical protein
MGWGQYYFYMGEIYFNFRNIGDGWFGFWFWFKYMVLNIPWLIFPFIAGAGFIWHIARHYKTIGVREQLTKMKNNLGNDFHTECNIFDQTNEQCEPLPKDNLVVIKRVVYFAFITPLIFLAIDMFRFYT